MTDGLEERLRHLGAFADELEAPGFELGHWHDSAPSPGDPSVWTMPWYELSPRGDAVFRALGSIVVVFDWPTWAQTDEARSLRDDRAVLAAATPEQLQHLVTWLVRAERFSDGGLESAFESGLLAAIARRAATLADGT